MSSRHFWIIASLSVVGLVVLSLLWGEEPKQAPTPPPPPPVVTLKETAPEKTKNGFEFSLATGQCQGRAALSLVFASGADHDPSEKSGMAFVIGHLLRHELGAATDDKKLLVGQEFTSVTSVGDEKQVKSELVAWANLLKSYEPSEDQLDQARTAALAEIERRRGGDPRATAVGYALESAHSSRAQGYLGGVTEQVRALTVEDVVTHFRTAFAPANLHLAVVGEVDAGAVTKALRETLGALDGGSPISVPEYGHGTVRGTLVMGSEPSVVALAVPAPPFDDEAYPGFLSLAGRLLRAQEEWRAEYDPLARPQALLLTQSFERGGRREPIADKMKQDLSVLVGPALTPEEPSFARRTFSSLLAMDELLSETCVSTVGERAFARARRMDLAVDVAALSSSLSELDETQLAGARSYFESSKLSAVGAGGKIE